ncbi:MAG TPA: site-2 protease family protein [Chitinophagaceae bacterium]|nr:site-2 protease family protein [Chitinophagaceae bacterium]
MRLSPALRTLLSLVLYAGIYYLIFRDARSIAFLLAVIIIHESGHFIAMRSFGYSNVRMLFVPMFGAFVSGQPAAVDPGKKMIVLFSGPLPGIILGMISVLVYTVTHQYFFYLLALMFIFLNVFNLLPVTPMDGGQMLDVLFPSYSKWVQTLFIILSSLALGIISYWSRNYLLIVLIFLLWFRLVVLWRTDPYADKKITEPHKELSDFQRLIYLIIWLAFIILPMITLFRIESQ